MAPGLAASLDLAALYAALSPEGREFLRKRKAAEGKGSPEFEALIADRASRKSLLSTLRLCDRIFHRYVTGELAAAAGVPKSALYSRVVPFAWIGLEIRKRLAWAFGQNLDIEDDTLLAVLIFNHRIWDDLLDRHAPEELLADFRDGSPASPEFILLGRFGALCRGLAADKGRLGVLDEIVRKSMEFYRKPFDPDDALGYLETKSLLSSRIHFMLLDEIPPALSEALPAFGLWLYALDDASDVLRDRARNRTTYMTLAADPVAEIRSFHDRCVEAVRARAARDPRSLFLMMRSMTAGVEAAIRSGGDIERDLFGGTPDPAIGNPGPSIR